MTAGEPTSHMIGSPSGPDKYRPLAAKLEFSIETNYHVELEAWRVNRFIRNENSAASLYPTLRLRNVY
jgi:hypothetical protein